MLSHRVKELILVGPEGSGDLDFNKPFNFLHELVVNLCLLNCYNGESNFTVVVWATAKTDRWSVADAMATFAIHRLTSLTYAVSNRNDDFASSGYGLYPDTRLIA